MPPTGGRNFACSGGRLVTRELNGFMCTRCVPAAFQPEWATDNQSLQLTSATQFSRGGGGEDDGESSGADAESSVDPAEKLNQVNAMIQVCNSLAECFARQRASI